MDTLLMTGELAPDFTLPDLEGSPHTVTDLRGRVVLINFWSAECPWAERTDQALSVLIKAWGAHVTWISLASNANESIELITQVAGERGLPLVLIDVGCQVADRYGAQTTPHLFVIDKDGLLRYQGAFDDVNFRQRTPTQFFLQPAVEALLAGRLPETPQTPSYGCSIVRYAP